MLKRYCFKAKGITVQQLLDLRFILYTGDALRGNDEREAIG